MINLLLKLYKVKVLRVFAYNLIKVIYCLDIPIDVTIGDNLVLPHNSVSTVIHPKTTIGNNCTIYQGVTIGRGNVWNKKPSRDFGGFIIEDSVILCAGAKIISSHGTLVVGRNSIVGSNAVLTKSCPPNSVCIGIPAKVYKSNNNNNCK